METVKGNQSDLATLPISSMKLIKDIPANLLRTIQMIQWIQEWFNKDIKAGKWDPFKRGNKTLLTNVATYSKESKDIKNHSNKLEKLFKGIDLYYIILFVPIIHYFQIKYCMSQSSYQHKKWSTLIISYSIINK